MGFEINIFGYRIRFGGKTKCREIRLRDVLLVIVIIAVFFAIFNIVDPGGPQKSHALFEAIDAYVSNDAQLWREQIHPVYGAEIMELDEVKASIESDGVVLGADATYRKDVVIGDVSSGEYGGNAQTMQIIVWCDDVKYIVDAVYASDESGSGIAEFTLRYDPWHEPTPTPHFEAPIRTPKVE